MMRRFLDWLFERLHYVSFGKYARLATVLADKVDELKALEKDYDEVTNAYGDSLITVNSLQDELSRPPTTYHWTYEESDDSYRFALRGCKVIVDEHEVRVYRKEAE